MTNTPNDETQRHARHAVRDELAARLPEPHVWEDHDTVNMTSQISSYSRADGVSSSWRIVCDGSKVSEVSITRLPIDKAKRIAAILAE